MADAPTADRSTAATVWAFAGPPGRRATAHAFVPQAGGWQAACGRHLRTEPVATPAGQKRCRQCSGHMTGTWRNPTLIIPKEARDARW